MPLGNGEHDDDTVTAHADVLCLHRERAPHVLRRCVADQLVKSAPRRPAQATQGTVVRHAQKDRAALGIGKGRHLGGERIHVGDIPLELASAVFAEGNLGLQVVQPHVRTSAPPEMGWHQESFVQWRGMTFGRSHAVSLQCLTSHSTESFIDLHSKALVFS